MGVLRAGSRGAAVAIRFSKLYVGRVTCLPQCMCRLLTLQAQPTSHCDRWLYWWIEPDRAHLAHSKPKLVQEQTGGDYIACHQAAQEQPPGAFCPQQHLAKNAVPQSRHHVWRSPEQATGEQRRLHPTHPQIASHPPSHQQKVDVAQGSSLCTAAMLTSIVSSCFPSPCPPLSWAQLFARSRVWC